MSIRVTCPRCDHSFEASTSETIVAPRVAQRVTRSTHRGMPAVSAPIREDAPTCARCGLTQALHEGEDNLARARYDCLGFERGAG